MADILLNVVVEGVLSKAFSLVTEEISMIFGVKEDLESLATNLEMIQALLADAESKHTSSKAVELWVKRLQNVSSEADNVLDDFAYEVLRKKMEKGKHKKVSSFFSAPNSLAFRFKIAHKIKKANMSIEEVFQEADRIGLRAVEIINMPTVNPGSNRLSCTDPFVEDSDIVGRNKEVDKIVSILTSSEKYEKNLPVVGIVGMPGLGKTTVAQLVYKNEKVVKHFHHRSWIHVSDDFNVERLLNDMVQSLTGTISDLTVGEAIVRKLNELLKAKMFLLVLDDVWNEDAEKWDRMRNCLGNCLREICGLKGSRILVTTRSEKVVSIMQASFTYQLEMLSDDDSWKLFDKIAFHHGGAVKTPELVDIGRKIVAKCGGVPLAVKAIGSLMYTKKDEREWSKIEKSETWGTLDEAGNSVKSAIKLSYDHLPSLSLKQCLACCSLFGKGSTKCSDIGLDNMIQLWMAQGLCNPSTDAGSQHIDILLQSSLLQVAKKDDCGKTTHLKIHDLVCDFVSEVAKDCFLVPLDKLVTKREILSKQRTLVLTGDLEFTLAKCKYVRVLTVVNEDVKELPRVIGKLKNLRYLDISRTSIINLPSSISKLYNLQTLRLYNLQQLPKKFKNMTNLRHLDIQGQGMIDGQPCLLPNIGQLSSLQTLPFFFVSREKGCQIDELGHLLNLEGNLKIFGLENVSNEEEAMKAKISSKINLDSLELHWDTKAREESTDEDVLKGLEPHSNLKGLIMENFMGQNLPSWMLNISHPLVLRNLVKIVLKNFNNCQQITPLGHLPYLKIVHIIGMESVKCINTDFYGVKISNDASSSQNGNGPATGYAVIAFPALKELILEDMPYLLMWSDLVCHDPAYSPVKLFPSLEILTIKKCPLLMWLPDDIWSHLSCIQELSIEDCQLLRHLPKDIGGLTSLKVLNLSSCSNLASIPDIHSLEYLTELNVAGCTKLDSLPRGIEFRTSISHLVVMFCPSLKPEDLHHLPTVGLQCLGIGGFSDNIDYFPWPNYTIPNNIIVTNDDNNDAVHQHPFSSLESLVICGWPKLKSLPEQIQHLSTLTGLHIVAFEGIEFLPEWLGGMQSLELLQIVMCRNLLHLPPAESMRRLTKLRKLEISDCPLLVERCKKETGPEWHKIAHIPEIEMK